MKKFFMIFVMVTICVAGYLYYSKVQQEKRKEEGELFSKYFELIDDAGKVKQLIRQQCMVEYYDHYGYDYYLTHEPNEDSLKSVINKRFLVEGKGTIAYMELIERRIPDRIKNHKYER